jgi:hypothetical protein
VVLLEKELTEWPDTFRRSFPLQIRVLRPWFSILAHPFLLGPLGYYGLDSCTYPLAILQVYHHVCGLLADGTPFCPLDVPIQGGGYADGLGGVSLRLHVVWEELS